MGAHCSPWPRPTEPYNITRGEYFATHHDGFDREWTVFVYLSDLPEGGEGETSFPVLGLLD